MGLVIGVSVPLGIAAASTVASLALGLWVAWLLVNRRFPGSRQLGALMTAGLALPAPVLCYSVLVERARGWSWGLAGAAVLAATPMLVRAGRMAFLSVDPTYGKAARSLGRSEWRVFWGVEFPLVWSDTAAAAAVALVRVLAEMAAAVVIAARLTR